MFLLPLISGFLGKTKWYLVAAVALLVIIGGAWVYWRWSRAEIAALKDQVAVVQKQADDLVVANQQMQADMAALKAAQDLANRQITDAQTKRDQAVKVIGQMKLKNIGMEHPRQLEQQINTQWSNILKNFEDSSHAP